MSKAQQPGKGHSRSQSGDHSTKHLILWTLNRFSATKNKAAGKASGSVDCTGYETWNMTQADQGSKQTGADQRSDASWTTADRGCKPVKWTVDSTNRTGLSSNWRREKCRAPMRDGVSTHDGQSKLGKRVNRLKSVVFGLETAACLGLKAYAKIEQELHARPQNGRGLNACGYQQGTCADRKGPLMDE